MFAPTIVEDLFGGKETIGAVCSQNMILNLFGIPAILASLYAIPYFGTKNVIIFSLVRSARRWPAAQFKKSHVPPWPEGMTNPRIPLTDGPLPPFFTPHTKCAYRRFKV